jgi:DeoR family transcriptional regulator of aga operon
MKDKQNSIFQEERREQILTILDKENRIIINDIVERFNTTHATIRKDLALLEKEGLLQRTHGGAIKNKSLFTGLALTEKEKLHLDEKIRIVKEAVKLISKGDIIILDSGSTTNLLAKEIKHFNGITVITNAINIASELMQSDIEVILLGGNLMKESAALVGPITEDALQKISVNKFFQGVDGIDFEVGLTTPDMIEAKTCRMMMNSASERILLVDSSKFGRRSLGIIAKVDELDKIITTKKLSKNEIQKYSDCGVEMIFV